MVIRGKDAHILSEKHKRILKIRIENRIKTVNNKDKGTVRWETRKKLATISSSKDFIIKLVSRVELLYQMLFDRNFPVSAKVARIVTAGLLYFISPGDFLPDDIPGLGYLDDAFVINEIWDKVSQEVQNYISIKGLDADKYI